MELALLQKYEFNVIMPFSKYASSIFAQTKFNGKLRLSVNNWKINTLVQNYCINNNNPVRRIFDSAQHIGRENLFGKLNCCQADNYLQMADQRLIELIASSFASRKSALRRLTQGLSLSLSAFSSFFREYLDPVIKANHCTQYGQYAVFGITAITPQQMIKNLRAVFRCLRKAGPKLSIAECHFEVQEVYFHGRTITNQGVAPQKQKINKFLK